jgi:hypothetical protein
MKFSKSLFNFPLHIQMWVHIFFPQRLPSIRRRRQLLKFFPCDLSSIDFLPTIGPRLAGGRSPTRWLAGKRRGGGLAARSSKQGLTSAGISYSAGRREACNDTRGAAPARARGGGGKHRRAELLVPRRAEDAVGYGSSAGRWEACNDAARAAPSSSSCSRRRRRASVERSSLSRVVSGLRRKSSSRAASGPRRRSSS